LCGSAVSAVLRFCGDPFSVTTITLDSAALIAGTREWAE
jgi:hypothetical protein